MSGKHIHFVTGRLAEHSLRSIAARLATEMSIAYSVDVLPITVAALMTPEWIARRIHVPDEATLVLIPGYCHGDLEPIASATSVPVQRGPRDLLQLPDYFGSAASSTADEYGDYDIEIIAEINHAPRLAHEDILRQAHQLRDDGADVIDVGCAPGHTWPGVGDCVRALRDAGLRVSIDSWNTREIEAAAKAGAELVLSVNATNRDAAPDWGCEVVVIPDDLATMQGLEATVGLLQKRGVPFRLDPVVEPIGLGFSDSLWRYMEVRRRYPECEILMGIGNLTELTDVDSAGVNVILLGLCQELGIRSVLTTQVINWARKSVRECDLARRLVHYAVTHRVVPKHIEPGLVMLRDTKLYEQGAQQLEQLAEDIKDHNYRLFAEDGQMHLLGRQMLLQDADPFVLFDKLMATKPKNVDASHAFYLGYELCKAVTALTLGKQYRQDEALDWGMLTIPETSHLARRGGKK